jgi:hypothetical protein
MATRPVHSAERVRVHAPARIYVTVPSRFGVERKFNEARGSGIEPIVTASSIFAAALSR